MRADSRVRETENQSRVRRIFARFCTMLRNNPAGIPFSFFPLATSHSADVLVRLRWIVRCTVHCVQDRIQSRGWQATFKRRRHGQSNVATRACKYRFEQPRGFIAEAQFSRCELDLSARCGPLIDQRRKDTKSRRFVVLPTPIKPCRRVYSREAPSTMRGARWKGKEVGSRN